MSNFKNMKFSTKSIHLPIKISSTSETLLATNYEISEKTKNFECYQGSANPL